VVEPARRLYHGEVDVQWGTVRWFEKIEHLIAAEAPNNTYEVTRDLSSRSKGAENR
jgi:hypothetical protein